MSRPNMTLDAYEANFSSLRASISKYDEINRQILTLLEFSVRRINNIILKFSVNIKKVKGQDGENFLRKRISSSFLQHQLDELNKMYDSLNILKTQLELVEDKYNVVRKALHQGLSVEGFSASEKYLNCYRQGVNKAKFYISKLEILIASSHKLGNQFPANALWFKSMELYIIGALMSKDYHYLVPYVPLELYPTV